MSLDGYIADKHGGVSWLDGDQSDSQNEGTYCEFIKTVDTVLMGKNTYRQIVNELSPDEWVYKGLKSYVITHHPLPDTKEIVFTDEAVCSLINRLKKQNGKDIWICGGASIIHPLVAANQIDKYRIAVIPILLGDGVRLFQTQQVKRKLRLISSCCYNGIQELYYEKRG